MDVKRSVGFVCFGLVSDECCWMCLKCLNTVKKDPEKHRRWRDGERFYLRIDTIQGGKSR